MSVCILTEGDRYLKPWATIVRNPTHCFKSMTTNTSLEERMAAVEAAITKLKFF
ncbi:hypothetical protein [Oscillatoria sp. HE19RPO]|uniref:hypothetical protein n=1 Tax=Oscillatoria sp. HE19RPO TaxID=2954806 RepID=UPI0020C487C7|nr:hypothetical protein [Oscillatoria sp. HE19RPO]